MKRNWVFDLEVFPNFFSALFIDLASDEERLFIVTGERNDLFELVDFFREEVAWIIGYNSSKYDDILLNYIFKESDVFEDTPENITKRLFLLSGEIINSQKNDVPLRNNEVVKKYLWPSGWFNSMDLMSMMYFDKKMIGLKKVAVSMKWPKIQDLPKPFDEDVKSDEIEKIVSYNRNDVLITKELAIRQKNEIQIRVDVGQLYGKNLMSASRSSMADILMAKFWSEETGLEYSEFKNLRTRYESITLSDCISNKVKFKTKPLQDFLIKMQNTVWTSGSKEIEFQTRVNNTIYDILLGGIHSVREPMIVEPTEDEEFIDFDVASYYPNLILTLGIFPKHLSDRFLKLYKQLVEQRMIAKKAGEKLTAEALKIVVNAVYGKLNFENGWLFDTKASYTVTLTGQLYLLMLIEALEMNGIEVFYANTDGGTCRVHKSKKAKFDEIVSAWQKYTELELEFAKYKKCIIRDVNNYLIIKTNGETKEKGCFTTEIDMSKGYNNPIVPLAIQKYYIDGIPIRETIENHKDIYDFCKSQNVGSQYKQEFYDLNEERTAMNVTICQKTNRYYVAKGTGKLYKVKADGSKSDLVSGSNVVLLNDYIEHKDFSQFKVDYNYYVHQANKIINVMEPNQLTLF